MKTYELRVASRIILGPDTDIKHPETWVSRRIALGEFHAFRVGHKYCMSMEQIREAAKKK